MEARVKPPSCLKSKAALMDCTIANPSRVNSFLVNSGGLVHARGSGERLLMAVACHLSICISLRLVIYGLLKTIITKNSSRVNIHCNRVDSYTSHSLLWCAVSVNV